MKRLKNLLHFLWGHDWYPWQTYRKAYDGWGYIHFFQRRECKICGKIQTRKESE